MYHIRPVRTEKGKSSQLFNQGTLERALGGLPCPVLGEPDEKAGAPTEHAHAKEQKSPFFKQSGIYES